MDSNHTQVTTLDRFAGSFTPACKKTDHDLKATYEYLSALPSLPNNPAPGP